MPLNKRKRPILNEKDTQEFLKQEKENEIKKEKHVKQIFKVYREKHHLRED